MAVCINCHIILLREQYEYYEYYAMDLSYELLSICEEWCGREVTDGDRLCQDCLCLLIQDASNRTENSDYISTRQVGHVSVCISCGISLSRQSGRRRRRLVEGTSVRTFIENHIFPRQVPSEAWSCDACWRRAYENRTINIPAVAQPLVTAPQIQDSLEVPSDPVVEDQVESTVPSSPVTVQSSGTDSWAAGNIIVPQLNTHQNVILENYLRTADSPAHCFVPDCANMERLRVPSYIKLALLSQHKNSSIYVTNNSRVCQQHSVTYNWDLLNRNHFSNSFTTIQIDEMLNLLSTSQSGSVVNFENIENVVNTLCHYWTGLSVHNFIYLFNSIPRVQNMKAKTALGIYLVKLRTGESLARIASLFLLSKTSVSTYIKNARNCMNNFYVPTHLGINHITREQHSSRNLLVPQGLFGTQDRNPIVICDGTYIFVQKSSNYFFQKKTYSLHKFRNLVKPFLMLTCDGHILDAFGPYAAVKSDADIMRELFQDENSLLRSYFRENDIFILDRGFRDSIGFLSALGYSVYKPESLSVGERQLSTINANKSRFVTLCRWVVEVVNGRFKRDFKIFRGEYFNVASKNLMTDFRIAAALINNFHPVITDHADAQAILDRALERVNMPNTLGDYIINNNINRQRANFVFINGQLPQLDVFPIMDMREIVLFGLGIYQIKQARSYYGEHIRPNGTFIIEVDTNLITYSSNSFLLRGRIKSRHQANKIYYSYILINLNYSNWCQRIGEYYCSCIIGRRTVGSCAHIMTLVWYLGWARHQNEAITAPASFLDDILLEEE